MSTHEAEKQGPGHHPHEFHIRVNTRPMTVSQERLTYEEVVRLAYPDADLSNPELLFTVTYRGEHHEEGQLVRGEDVKVHDGMAFNVKRTIRS